MLGSKIKCEEKNKLFIKVNSWFVRKEYSGWNYNNVAMFSPLPYVSDIR